MRCWAASNDDRSKSESLHPAFDSRLRVKGVPAFAAKARRGLRLLGASGFPFHLPAAGARRESLRVRRAARHAILARWPFALRPFAAAAMCVLWPLSAVVAAWSESRRWACPTVGGGRWRLFARGVLRALRHNQSPWEAIAFRPSCEGEGRADDWLCQHEAVALALMMTPASASALARDKEALKRRLARRGLPVSETLVLIEGVAGDTVRLTDLLAEAGGAGIAVKPRCASMSRGVELWLADNACFRSSASTPERLTPDRLARRIMDGAARGDALMVERLLLPHPVFAPRFREIAPVLRLITAAGPGGGRAVLVAAILGLKGEDCFGSAIAHRFQVDLETGRVVEAGNVLSRPPFRHLAPSRPVEVIGTTLPGWKATVAAVLAGHAAFPEPVPMLGWDVALARQGPVILEANIIVSMTPWQILSGRPALSGPLGPLLDTWVAARV